MSIQTQSDVKPREGPWPYRLVAVLSVAFVFVAFTQPMLAWQPALAALAISMRPRALVRFLAVATFVLLLIGGAVTTYRVGMAVPDWPQTMGHNMFTYPLSEMIKSGPVSLEHSHRLWATGVGLITVCLAVGCFLRPEGRELRALSIVALIAVCIQGVLGGTRVLENSTNLAFLHGAFAQVFYAIVAVLFRACHLPTVQAGDIFAVFRYLMLLLMGLDGLPRLIQQVSRLRDVSSRLHKPT